MLAVGIWLCIRKCHLGEELDLHWGGRVLWSRTEIPWRGLNGIDGHIGNVEGDTNEVCGTEMP